MHSTVLCLLLHELPKVSLQAWQVLRTADLLITCRIKYDVQGVMVQLIRPQLRYCAAVVSLSNTIAELEAVLRFFKLIPGMGGLL